MKKPVQNSAKQAKLRTGRMFMAWRLRPPFFFMLDNVNHPDHYQGSLECITAIRAALTPEEFRGFCKGNVLKYAWRERHKGQDESLAKARWYIDQLIDPT